MTAEHSPARFATESGHHPRCNFERHGSEYACSCAEYPTEHRCKCDNCDWSGLETDVGRTLHQIHHLAERLDVGGTVPAGECPECGCLAYRETSQ